jgi:hypothetical protein
LILENKENRSVSGQYLKMSKKKHKTGKIGIKYEPNDGFENVISHFTDYVLADYVID